MKVRVRVFHPLAVALFPVLLIWSRNSHSIPARETVLPAALILLATTTVWAVLRWLWRDPERSALVASFGVLAFFSFGRSVYFVERAGFPTGSSPAVREWLVFGAGLGATAALVGLVRRWPLLVRLATPACNAGSIALVALALWPAVVKAWSEPAAAPPVLNRPETTTLAKRRPDIYFLILDSYGRSDVLKEIYGFDNGAFLDRLERKGFFIARRSTANYCQTGLSISATLNGRYHEGHSPAATSRVVLKNLIADNPTFRTLKKQGYRIAAFATGFGLTDLAGVDLRLAPPGNLSEFDALLVATTPTALLLGRRPAREPFRAHRARILYTFDHLPDLAQVPGPTFCLAHVVAPHPPFIFGPDGSDVSRPEEGFGLTDGTHWAKARPVEGSAAYVSRYRDQITYITRRAEATIDHILAASPEPPVIIVQGDHGPGSCFDGEDDRPNDLHERMSILNACYLPDLGRDQFSDAITPINTLRLILNHYFNTNLEPLPDRNFFSSYPRPYAFTEVTGQVKPPTVISD